MLHKLDKPKCYAVKLRSRQFNKAQFCVAFLRIRAANNLCSSQFAGDFKSVFCFLRIRGQIHHNVIHLRSALTTRHGAFVERLAEFVQMQAHFQTAKSLPNKHEALVKCAERDSSENQIYRSYSVVNTHGLCNQKRVCIALVQGHFASPH